MDSASTSAASNEPLLKKGEKETIMHVQTTAAGFNLETPVHVQPTSESNTVKMSIAGLDDEAEEKILMTTEEVQQYIVTKIIEYWRDPNRNQLLLLKNQQIALQENIKQKYEELMKVNRVLDILNKEQEKFLRHIGVLPKIQMKHVQVHVDLAWIPDSVRGMLAEDAFKAKTLSENLLRQNKVNNPNSILAGKPIEKKKEPTGPIECIDLTDDSDAPDVPASSSSNSIPTNKLLSSSYKPLRHPAPLPPVNNTCNPSDIPPKPRLKLSAENRGIILQWDLPPPTSNITITSFEIFGYQEKANVPITSDLWKKMGSVKPMTLPMSCTLTHFVEGNTYHFSVRAVTTFSPNEQRYGFFSDPRSIRYSPEKTKN